jgi:hypothetical protein
MKMKRAGWVIKKTVRKAERAWFLDGRRGERSLRPSGISSLGKSRVFSKHPACSDVMSSTTEKEMLHSRNFFLKLSYLFKELRIMYF